MAWKRDNPGCGCCGSPWKFHINGCAGTGLAGATIELRQSGTLIDSCVTADGTGGTTIGECTMAVPAGSYDVTITGPSGAGFAAQTFTASAAPLTTRTMAADSSHVCVTLCNYPIPKTLFTTDGLGTHTLTWNGTVWAGTASTSVNTIAFPGVFSACVAGGAMVVDYTLSVNLTLNVGWQVGACGGGGISPAVVEYRWAGFRTFSGTCLKSTGASGTSTVNSCFPLSVTANVATTGLPVSGGINFCGTGTASTTYDGYDTPGGGGALAVTP